MNEAISILDAKRVLNVERVDDIKRAAHNAASWEVSLRPATPSGFQQRILAARAAVEQLERELENLPANRSNRPIAGLLELRANPRLLRSAVAAVTPHPRDRDDLPRVLLGGNREEPRVATLAAAYLDAVHGEVSATSLALYVQQLQLHEPLLLIEVWNIPSYLNFVLLERILAAAGHALNAGDADSDAHILAMFSSLRTAMNAEWSSILESLIAFDGILRQDPSGTYPRMDLVSRQQYRNRIALIARHSDFTEAQVAAQALELARDAAQETYADPRKQQRYSHIGYYLVDKGFARLAEGVNFHPPFSFRVRSFIRRNADDFYITSIELITIFFIAAAIFPLLPSYPVFGRLAIAFLLMIMPAMQCAVELVNNTTTTIFDPEPLPKLDFTERIPLECATLVAVPTLLLNEKQVREMVNGLEVRFLANRDPNLHFALITDLPDSVSKPHTHDSNPLVDLAIQLIGDLNARYASPGNGSFLFLHRHRIFNVRQGVWMGWERKRGKLLDLNKLLVGEFDAFPIKAGKLEALRTVRYILTLDSDTQLPRGTAARMAGAIAHPLNQAIIDPKLRIVEEGYGILQPRVGVSVSSALRSRLAALYSGQSGFDIYSRAISDAYQDLYGEGIFTGKGIYEVAALHTVLNRRFPRNTLLSHDLIEGAYARVGLTTDIEVIDDYPSHYSAFTRRKHRWVRGDWQIARWMFSRVPDESNRLAPNPISTISRWKIFDNLRRSLVEPFTFILFVAGWLWLPGGPMYWTVVLLLLFFFPTLVQTAFGVGRALLSGREGAAGQALSGGGHSAQVTLLNLFFLPHQAMLSLDAVLRALIRRFITGERLLEWETAAEAESHTRRSTPVDRYLTLMPLVAGGLAIVIYLLAPQRALLVAAPILLGWCMATVVTAWLNRPPQELRLLSPADRSFLIGHALRIWRYFNQFGGESHNYLIPDNVEEKGMREAPRISPTNVGLLLNARQAACELGFLTIPEFAFLTQQSLDTVGHLEKLRGHLYNWYDTRTCQPLEANPFVSTVDSGNLVASFYTLHSGALGLLKKPLLSRQLFTGIRTHWDLLSAQGKLPPAVSRLSLPGTAASISEWLAWLPSAAAALQAALTIPPSSTSDPWWFAETLQRITSIQTLVSDHLPWLHPRFAPLREVSEFDLNAGFELLSIDQAALFAEMLERSLAPDSQLDGDNRTLAEELHAVLPSAIRNLRELAANVYRIAQQALRLAEETEFGFLVNPSRHILSIGYDVRNQRTHDACYDMLASEARIATFLAIARGELPQQSWFKLARDHTIAFGTHIVLSWTGTMFEYMMPSLWMRSYSNTLLADTMQACVSVQQAYARSLGIPWGISESGAARRDDSGNYGYHAFGVPQMAISTDATAGPVISPYSTFLALNVDTGEAIRNLRHMASAGWVGPYGFYESTDYTTSTHRGDLVREWMAHHQGMSLLALLNCLCGNVAQEWFHSNALIQSTELLLHESQISKGALKAMMKDFAFVPPKTAEAA